MMSYRSPNHASKVIAALKRKALSALIREAKEAAELHSIPASAQWQFNGDGEAPSRWTHRVGRIQKQQRRVIAAFDSVAVIKPSLA